MYGRERTRDGLMQAEYVSEPRKSAVHERLLNIDTNSTTRPFYRRSHKNTEPITLSLDHIR